jgi:SAM-dependent methyltransferase
MKLKYIYKLLAWEMLNPFLLRIKRRKKYLFGREYIGINLGCGLYNPHNWIGIDGGITHLLAKKMPKIFIKRFFKHFDNAKNYSYENYKSKVKSFKFIHFDLRYGIPFNDNSIPNIFSSHFMEHLYRDDCEKLLKDCYRVIKPNGIIRICIPSLDKEVEDIQRAIHEYGLGNLNSIQKYVTNENYGYISKFSCHRYMYNFNEFKKILNKVGFSNVKEFSFKVGNIPDVKSLDTQEGLFVEAIKTIN